MAAPERGNEVASDTETSEKPVREQLKKATISKSGGGGPNMADEEDFADTEQLGTNGEKTEDGEQMGRVQRKRSFEESEGHQGQGSTSEPTRHHTRKRSRDSTAEEDELNNGQRKSGERTRDDADAESHAASNGKPRAPADERSKTPEPSADKRGEAAVEAMTSPKSKRSRLHSTAEEADDTPIAEHESSSAKGVTSDSGGAVEKAQPSTEAGEQKPATKNPPTSGFANTSASSPFASLPGSKSPSSEPLQTSASAFKASGFGSLSGSATSGFGAIGKSSRGFGSGGGFATGSKSPTPVRQEARVVKETEIAKPEPSSIFGGASGQKSTSAAAGTGSSSSPFSSGASAFGKLAQSSSGFGGAGLGGLGGLGGASGLTSFASGKPSSALIGSSKPAKTFGAPADEEAEAEEGGDGEDDSGFKSPLSQESDKQDERFYLQELETGEEDEITEYSCRAKLYNFATVAEGKKEWKERGLGIVRLNVNKPAPGEEDEDGPKARLLMRAEGSHRVILNTPVKKEITFGGPTGGQPQGGYVYFMGAVDGKEGLELLQLKVSSCSANPFTLHLVLMGNTDTAAVCRRTSREGCGAPGRDVREALYIKPFREAACIATWSRLEGYWLTPQSSWTALVNIQMILA